MVLLLAASLYVVETCPSSCEVCSEEATVCQGLQYIIALPRNSKVVVITEGDVSLIGINNFSHLLDLTLLELRGNKIKKIQDGAFSNLPKLQTLILDHNQISSTSISNGTFFTLSSLETLQLNSNFFGGIDGTWFRNTEGLIRLEINRNHITNLTHKSLGSNALHHLQYLDLSNNFISFIHEGTFQSLQKLKELDLSKNRLTKLPNLFSFLSRLSLLNLSHNYWNCSCELYQLAEFLRSYTNSTRRLLKNRNGLRCNYSSNSTVVSLLQLTDRNCGSRSYNITVITREKNSGSTREGLLIAILVITGIIAFSFLLALIVKCSLKLNKSIEPRPAWCSCREAQHLPAIRGPVQNIDVTQEEGSDVMSSADPRRIGRIFQKKRPGSWPPLGCNVQDSGRSTGRYYICFQCRLVQWRPPSPTARSDTNEVGCISNSIQRIPDNPKDFVHAAPREGANTTVLQELSRFNKGKAIPEITWSELLCNVLYEASECETEDYGADSPLCAQCMGDIIAAVTGAETTEGETSGRRDMSQIRSGNFPQPDLCRDSQRNMGPYKQNADVMSRLTTKGSAEMKMHVARPPPRAHRSLRGGPGVLLNERKDISSQTDNDLICKYMECDKLEEPRRQITEPETQNVKFEEQKIQSRVTEENCFLNNDGVLLSARIRKVNIPKSVGFYIPHIQHKSDMAVNTPQSRQEQLCRPHLGSKYLLTINNQDYEARQTSCTGTLVDTLKDVYINCNTMYSRKEQDHLRVKVNLQPFRKVRVHPQQNMEATKRGHRLPPQSPRKKSRPGNSSSSSSQTKPTTQTMVMENDTSLVDRPSKVLKDQKAKYPPKSKGKMERGDNENDKSGKEAMTPVKEEDDKLEGLSIGKLEGPSIGKLEGASVNVLEDQGSKTAFNCDEALKCEEKRSAEQSHNPGQLKDLEIQDKSEELTETQPQTQLENQDNTGDLCGNALDPPPSNVTGISGGTDSSSSGNNINCEIDITASSLPGNKVNGHLEGNRRDDITEAGHLPGPDNSIKNTTINEATDGEIKEASDGSPAQSKADETGLLIGEREDVHTEGNEKVMDHADHGEIFPASSLQSAPSRDDPPLSGVIDLQRNINQQVEKTPAQDHKLDGMKVARQDVALEPDLPLKSHQSREAESPVKNEDSLIPSQNNEAPEGSEAQTSAAPPQPNRQSNANNNHSKASAESGRKRLSLSDTSKVIIVVESLNETINIQKYLSERNARRHTWQATNHPANDNDSAPGDGSQRKKICLILPEKSGARAPKSASKKIK